MTLRTRRRRFVSLALALAALLASCGPAATSPPAHELPPRAEVAPAPAATSAPPAAVAEAPAVAPVAPAAPAAPVNGVVFDFEDDTLRQAPSGWKLPEAAASAGYSVVVGDHAPFAGRLVATLSHDGSKGSASGPPGDVERALDLERFRGRRVKLRVAVRVEGETVRAQMWFVTKGPSGGYLSTPTHRTATWGTYELFGVVPMDTTEAFVALAMSGNGGASFDDVVVEDLGAVGDGDEPARPLAGRALANVVAFARLYGYLRYFHPSDESAAADWTALALDGVRFVEDAKDPAELADRLTRWFAPVAPTLVVHAGRPRAPRPAPAEAPGRPLVRWVHHGVGLDATDPTYHSDRVKSDAPDTATSRWLAELDAKPYRGGYLCLDTWARTTGPGARVRIGLEVTGEKSEAVADMRGHGVTSATWTELDVVVEVPKDATDVALSLWLEGEGAAFFDDVRLMAQGETGGCEPVAFEHGDMEKVESRGRPVGWSFESERPGARPESSPARPHAGAWSASITHPHRDDAFADRGLAVALGGGVSCELPVVLATDGARTLPVASATAPTLLPRPQGWQPTDGDRATRLADVVILWNVFEHFSPYFDVARTDWPATLPGALAEAAVAPGAPAQALALSHLVAKLHDGHGGVWGATSSGGVPVRFDWVAGKLVVVAVGKDVKELEAGDVVTRYAGLTIRQLRADLAARFSAATPQLLDAATGWRLSTALEGKTLALDVEGKDGRPRHVELAVLGRAQRPSPKRPEMVAELEPGIVYVDLTRVSAEELEAADPRLQKATGVVFDLRGYPKQPTNDWLGLLTEVPVSTARWLIPIVTRPDHVGMEFVESGWLVQPKSPRLTAKVVVLTNGSAVSYAETMLGIIAYYHLATIVGGTTAGTNGNVSPIALPSGESVTWTGMKVLKHDGSRHHGVGIQPDIRVAPTVAGIRAGRDEVLERGIQAAKTGK
jgi:hypothetical protein